jgi:hypothetical protein
MEQWTRGSAKTAAANEPSPEFYLRRKAAKDVKELFIIQRMGMLWNLKLP